MKIGLIEIEYHLSLFALLILKVKEEQIDELDDFFSSFSNVEITKERYEIPSEYDYFSYKVVIREGDLNDFVKICEFVKSYQHL